MRKNKFVNFLIVISLLLSNIMPIVANASDYDSNKMVTYLNSVTGNSYAKGYCLGFVDESFQNVYGFREYSCCAYKAGSLYLKSTSKNNIPIGACVFFSGSSTVCSTCKNNAGHVGIYVGDGNFVHVWSGQIKKTTIDYVISCGYSYRGWGWLCNVELTGGGAPTNVSITPELYNNPINTDVKFTLTYSNADWAAIVLIKGTQRISVETITGQYTYTHKFTEPGEYTVQLETWNNNTYCTVKTCTINVYSAPTNVSITPELYNNPINTDVKFTLTYSNADWAAIVLIKGTQRISVETITGQYTYTHKFTESGEYTVQLETWNNNTYCTVKTCTINVYSARPSNVTISANKTYVSPGEAITFTYTQKDASYWYFVAKKGKDGERLCTELMTGKDKYTYTFNDVGEYETILSTANNYGWTNASIIITVSKAPEKPELKSMKASYLPDEDVVFDWNATGATTHYNLYIHKKNENGVYGAYENIFYANSGISRTLEPGEYQALLQSINSNYYTDDGSTWRFTDSDIYEFKVVGHSVVYDLNGGDGEAESTVVSEVDAEIKITDAIPEKEGYKFLGWAASKDAAEAEYHAGDSFIVTEDTTLYAVWQCLGIYVEASLTPSGKDYLCKVKIHDPYKGDLSYVPYEVYVPYYKDGRLVDVAWWDRVMWSDMYAILGDFDMVKVIVWESGDSMLPIAEPVTLYK